jgi:putative drug exporter of the RND superfamily
VTQRMARACAAHPWRTMGVWLVAIVLGVVGAAAGLGDLTTEGEVTNNPDSIKAERLIDERLPDRRAPSEMVIVRSERLTVDQPAFRAEVRRLAGIARSTGDVAGAAIYYQRPDPRLVSSDRHALLIPIQLRDESEGGVEDLADAVEAADGRNGFSVSMTGEWTVARDLSELSQSDLQEGELRIGLPAALIILVLVFGALVAAGLPLLLAIVSIIVALGLTGLVAQGFTLSVFVINMLTGMGLALGIDYCLFVVSRVREERARGAERLQAISRAGATASRAVLFSGSAFVLAMLGLLIVPSTIMRSLATGAILVGVVTVVAALTLLPALLGLLGDRINALRVPVVGRWVERGGAGEGGFWARVARAVTARPALALALAAALLLAAAVPLFSMNIGAASEDTLPDRLESKQGLVALQRSFPAASAQPAEVVIDGPPTSPQIQAAVGRLRQELARDGRFGGVQVARYPNRDLTLASVGVGADPLSDEAMGAVRDLRSRIIPAAFAGEDGNVVVGGTTAENVDFVDVMDAWLPIVFVFVLGLSLVLLTVAFRSVVVAGTAIVLNLLSVGAAYGLMVLVFQHGVGADLFGFQEVETIEAWVPLFLFAVLFGLSMDYQVFLLSRIRERFTETGDTTEAVVSAVGSTARIITGAALIIVAVFVGFAAGELVMFQQMGFGVAVALLIDATIVRSVLVPAAMTLLGKWNWYLPTWLDWLPRVQVEGRAARPGAGPMAPATKP